MKKIFFNQLFCVKEIYNALCISDYSNEITSLIENKCEVFFATFDCDGTKILPLCSQMLVDIDSKSLDVIYINKRLKNIDMVIDKLLSENGVVVVDDISFESNNLELIFEHNTFRVFQRKNLKDNFFVYDDMMKRVKCSYQKIKEKDSNKVLNIGIGVFTYNHENYILECLNGIFKQKGNYNYNLVIIDDASTDDTCTLIRKFLNNNNKDNIKVNFIKNRTNKGVISSFKKVLELFKNTDYFTFCEGDDYWNDINRINKFVNYMQKNPMVSLAFNSMFILNDNEKSFYKNKYNLQRDYFLTQELILKKYFIGNLGCCFYDSYFLKFIDNEIFNLNLYDFFFNTYYSTFGLIGYVREYLSTYRMHDNSLWSGLSNDEKNIKLYNYINEYNKYFNYIYDYEFSEFQNYVLTGIESKVKDTDLVIIDNVFPHPLSSFTYEEISWYLRKIKNSMALCTYTFADMLGSEPLRVGLKNFKLNNADIFDKVTNYNKNKLKRLNPKLLYFIFKSTTMYYYELIKESNVPFVFELYPGGGMLFDDDECDMELRKIMSLKNFKKVIVTQETVKEYLLKKKLCKENQIEMIFGVVMNIENCLNYKKGNFYGNDKNICDIVFMAHRYNKIGNDKGYDVFIDSAKELCKKYDNIRFHVVGNYDENVINLDEIGNYITFYGNLNKHQFDDFFRDKDIIISPNKPNILKKGAFDGFPTASVTEAGIRKTVMICSDELNMCRGYYKNRKDLIITKPNVEDVLNCVEYLYNHPKKIKEIAENGYKRILELYSYDFQIKPRINLLNKIIKEKIKCQK